MEEKQIFRKVALERLSSPEQLDKLMQITHPRTWIAVAGLMMLLAAIVVWGFLGSIPTKVEAQGVLIKPGGVVDVFSTGAGPIVELIVAAGEQVTKGQVVARIARPDLDGQIEAAKADLNERLAEHAKLTAFASEDLGLRDDALKLQDSKLTDTMAFAAERLTALQQQIDNQQRLLEKGLVTTQNLLQAKQEYYATKDLMERSRSDQRQIPIERLSGRMSKERDIVQSQMAINDARRKIELLQQQLQLTTDVISPATGRVVEVKKNRGDVIAAGTPVVSLQLSGQDTEGLQAIIYVPPNEGKNVTRGLEVQLSPTTAKREEFGYMLGKVTSVSEFPATADGMMRVLSNPGLVQVLSAQGPPFVVYADLVPDPTSPSGYAWSSPKGAQLTVNSGTICNVTLTVRSSRPVELVIPVLREYLGL